MVGTGGFVGRESELSALQWHTNKKVASLIVVKGRRRIGKSRLIEEFCTGYPHFIFSGVVPTSQTTRQSQLDEFASQFGLLFQLPGLRMNDWNVAFKLLADRTQQGRMVIVLDEISWVGSKDPDFLGKLKNAWDLYFKKNPELILIICGSASHWIEKNIMLNTGFMGRISFTLTVDELPLSACRTFWEGTGQHFSAYEKLKLLSITGGIPRYLEEIHTQYGAEENIRHLCFEPGGLLVNEFRQIFSDLFGKRSEKYKTIVSYLVNGPLEYREICEKLGVTKSGLISEYLNDLILSGFISRDQTWNPQTRLWSKNSFKYRLRDNYIRFYLKYIEKNMSAIEKSQFAFKTMNALPGWATILGLQFENLVLNNRHFIQQKLRVMPEDVLLDNPYFQHTTSRQSGCQIDYMIQTKTQVVYVVEIKFSQHPLQKSVILETQDKIKKIRKKKGVSFCPVLVHVNGIHPDISDAQYFTHVIDFSEALG